MSESYTCKECGFNLWLPIDCHGMLNASSLGLYNDGRFPGRCLLAFDPHYENLTELDDEDLLAFMRNVRSVGDAIQKATGADRMNYAILGNAVPHVHCHIIPRFFDNDPNPKSTPWSRNDKAWQMEKERYEKIMADISLELKKAYPR